MRIIEESSRGEGDRAVRPKKKKKKKKSRNFLERKICEAKNWNERALVIRKVFLKYVYLKNSRKRFVG